MPSITCADTALGGISCQHQDPLYRYFHNTQLVPGELTTEVITITNAASQVLSVTTSAQVLTTTPRQETAPVSITTSPKLLTLYPQESGKLSLSLGFPSTLTTTIPPPTLSKQELTLVFTTGDLVRATSELKLPAVLGQSTGTEITPSRPLTSLFDALSNLSFLIVLPAILALVILAVLLLYWRHGATSQTNHQNSSLH